MHTAQKTLPLIDFLGLWKKKQGLLLAVFVSKFCKLRTTSKSLLSNFCPSLWPWKVTLIKVLLLPARKLLSELLNVDGLKSYNTPTDHKSYLIIWSVFVSDFGKDFYAFDSAFDFAFGSTFGSTFGSPFGSALGLAFCFRIGPNIWPNIWLSYYLRTYIFA